MHGVSLQQPNLLYLLLRNDRGEEYRDERVCVCVCPRSYYLRNYTSDLHQFFVHVTYGRGSVLLWRRNVCYVLPVLWMTS